MTASNGPGLNPDTDRAWVRARLREVAERTMQAVPVTDSKGEPTGAWTFNAAGANRALELLGRELGMFVDRKDHRIGPLEAMTHDELTALIDRIDGLAAGLEDGGGAAAQPAGA